ncbi:FHA domain-containing protein [Sphingobium sp. PAMC28499]|jgi:pSer/pThr/pTyr-binding forkhead associated (FHA) protein|uniref:FHA domain-containing protein n=1 Tax=Sphingobium yanoikuyae TaxID=13690 RepID=A0A6M4G5U5_SPHYA|nr:MULTISPECIES: FHA domain-containing protein [Sphingobium]QCB39050.1 FHA domain-containing protein [Sphingobium sp. PAMC28499]QJR02521.1 FHA domain-containing protein [Sphingobium yanoikuyae]
MLELIALPIWGTLSAALIAACASIFVAYRTVSKENRKRRGEIAIEITRLLLDPNTSQGAQRRFAVGILKIQSEPPERVVHKGIVLFVALNSRVTIGRDPGNDLMLSADDISRFHCGLISEGEHVFLEDYCSTNGVHVNGREVRAGGSVELDDGDTVVVGDYVLRFQKVHCSSLIK